MIQSRNDVNANTHCIESSTVITLFNLSRYCIEYFNDSSRTKNRLWTLKRHPISRPHGRTHTVPHCSFAPFGIKATVSLTGRFLRNNVYQGNDNKINNIRVQNCGCKLPKFPLKIHICSICEYTHSTHIVIFTTRYLNNSSKMWMFQKVSDIIFSSIIISFTIECSYTLLHMGPFY